MPEHHFMTSFPVPPLSFPAGSFPVDSSLPELKRALAEHGVAILCAPPGSGKTTRVPLALASGSDALPGTILTLEPRRLAARAAAAFMARSLGEETGRTVGYRVRLDSRVSPATRVEMLTEGVLTRRLLHDPALFSTNSTNAPFRGIWGWRCVWKRGRRCAPICACW